jgi:hypothetical protein
MFLQVFSTDNPAPSFYDSSNILTIILQLKCRIINGDNDALIHDRDLTELKRAYVFSEPGSNDQPLAQLEFASDDTSVPLLTPQLFSFKTPGPSYRKLTNKKNIGGNTATGALTLFTGVDFGKSKVNKYSADFPFVTDSDSFHCIINYWEMEVAERKRTEEKEPNGHHSYGLESGAYNFAQRGTDSTFINAITLGADTITSFTITYVPNEQRNYTRLWDGTDTSTVMPLLKEWNNTRAISNVFIKGTMYGKAFIMQSSRERAIKNFL